MTLMIGGLAKVSSVVGVYLSLTSDGDWRQTSANQNAGIFDDALTSNLLPVRHRQPTSSTSKHLLSPRFTITVN